MYQAYRFIAHDRAGMKLKDVTDGGYCFWEGSADQESEASFLEAYFLENNSFPYES